MNKSGTIKVLRIISGLSQQNLISARKRVLLLEEWKLGNEREVVEELQALNTNEFWKKELESILF